MLEPSAAAASVLRLPSVRRSLLLAAAGASLLSLGAVLLLRPDPRSAWQQAALTQGLPMQSDPIRQSAWSEGVRQLLREADGLGPRPDDPGRLARWLEAQCRLNLRLQALQRQQGRPVESAVAMGRPAACEALAQRPGPQDPPGGQPGAAGAGSPGQP